MDLVKLIYLLRLALGHFLAPMAVYQTYSEWIIARFLEGVKRMCSAI
jgi:hypothetical protein